VIRAHAECSPCLLRDCPIDHRCMARVSADSVAAVAQELWEVSAPASASETWTPEKR
jgi:heptosyltransferase-2